MAGSPAPSLTAIQAEKALRQRLRPNWLPRQQEALDTFERLREEGHDVPKILYGGAMGGGKSFFGCLGSVILAEQNPGIRQYLCRKELAAFTKTTLQTMLQPAPVGVEVLSRPGWHHHQTGSYFWHDNGSRIDYGALSGNEQDKERIKSLIITTAFVDEASEVDQQSARLLEARCHRQMQFDHLARVLYASNPEACWLQADFIENPKPGRAFVQALPEDNTYLGEGYVRHLEETYEDFPDLLAAYLRGDWNSVSGVDKVFPATLLHMATKNVGAPGTRQWGVDVARFGDDKTTVWERVGTFPAHKLMEFAKQDTRTTSDKLVNLYNVTPEDRRPEVIAVDDSGVGGGVTDNLNAARLPVLPVNAGESALEPDKFFNMRAELHWHARIVLEAGGALPDDAELRSQLAAPSYSYRSGRLLVEPKDAIKKRLGRSPDDADAWLLAYAPMRATGNMTDYYTREVA